MRDELRQLFEDVAGTDSPVLHPRLRHDQARALLRGRPDPLPHRTLVVIVAPSAWLASMTAWVVVLSMGAMVLPAVRLACEVRALGGAALPRSVFRCSLPRARCKEHGLLPQLHESEAKPLRDSGIYRRHVHELCWLGALRALQRFSGPSRSPPTARSSSVHRRGPLAWRWRCRAVALRGR